MRNQSNWVIPWLESSLGLRHPLAWVIPWLESSMDSRDIHWLLTLVINGLETSTDIQWLESSIDLRHPLEHNFIIHLYLFNSWIIDGLFSRMVYSEVWDNIKCSLDWWLVMSNINTFLHWTSTVQTPTTNYWLVLALN